MIESIKQLTEIMKGHGVSNLYAKKLSPNDNSKNQVYLGGNFSALNIIPHGEIHTDGDSNSGSKRDRAKAPLTFFWVDVDGLYQAHHAQLILYPKYPEVRMSGFLKQCRNSPSSIMSSREEGRTLFIGVSHKGEIIAHATDAGSNLSTELYSHNEYENTGVFIEIPLVQEAEDSKTQLIKKLTAVYYKGWIASKKLNSNGGVSLYAALNGGGYTLEAELGVCANSYSEPDFLGWEVKQYSVEDFKGFRPKTPVTLMTPEPNGGIYQQEGAGKFIDLYGYADKKGRANRINFGGIYRCDAVDYHADTGLKMSLLGYDYATKKITDMNGGIALLSRQGEIAALWGFIRILEHWKRKHAKTAYIPSLFQTPPPEYSFGSKILLCEQTDFDLFLKALIAGKIYYDPAIKLEYQENTRKIKKRSQFRVLHDHVTRLYHKSGYINLGKETL
jgi:hypothetical protein